MLRITLLCFFACCFSCKIFDKKEESQRERNLKNTIKYNKDVVFNVSKIKFSLEIKEHENSRGIVGVMLDPIVDKEGAIIKYQAFNGSSCYKSRDCINGEIDGLSPEPKYDFPQGELTVIYRACVDNTTICSKPKTTTYNNKGGGVIPESYQEDAQVSNSIKEETIKLSEVFKSYKDSETSLSLVGGSRVANRDRFTSQLISKQLKINPNIISCLYNSSKIFEKIELKVKEVIGESGKNSNALSLKSLALLVLVDRFSKEELISICKKARENELHGVGVNNDYFYLVSSIDSEYVKKIDVQFTSEKLKDDATDKFIDGLEKITKNIKKLIVKKKEIEEQIKNN